ncbi:hypothetical protein FNF27_02297 [Cafeteria roenbergensis]|uniref:Glycoside hydrolase family 38 central domain-containing protein n=1 Tax=Cafeteria roenbergensis TaxID=33653 RepID=A0A5A8EJZ1_CAFRO|nr:hypothetical protein FNF27_02297 [Cafeteria roenbergensis]
MADAAMTRLVAEHASDAVVFVWNSDCEAAAWVNGTTMCGLTGGDGGEIPENSDRRAEVVLAPSATTASPRAGLAAWAAELGKRPATARPGPDTTEGGFVCSMVVEVACNGMFGVGGGTMIGPPDPHRTFPLKEAHCAVVDGLGWRLYHAFLAAVDIAKACEAGSPSQRRALFAGNAALNAFDRRHRPSWERALAALQPLFEAPLVSGVGPTVESGGGVYVPGWARRTARRRRAAPRVHALGHCHIDTAWLWPIAESARKARRSWASVVDLLAGRRAPGPATGLPDAAPARGSHAEGEHEADVGPGCAWGEHPGAAPLVFAVSQPAQMAMLTGGEPWWDGAASCGNDGSGPGAPPAEGRGCTTASAAGRPAARPGAGGDLAAAAAAVKCGDGALWARLKAAVAAGGVVPVGGMWVEPDANLIGGESWVRQLVEARRWYACNLVTESSAGAYLPGAGHSPSDVARACAWEPATAAAAAAGPSCARFSHGVAWLPDTFGMQCAQLPALLRGAGMDAFLTQKLSWSLVHKHPHTTFHWRAPSGQRVLAHFPPSDSYNTKARAADLVSSRDKNKDAGRCDATALLFGHGDGGGGPTAAMLASLSVLQGAEGMPDLVSRGTSPAAFFEDAAFDAAASRAGLSTWDGEIHLELHQGTYTSIPAIKRAHQDAEAALLIVAEAAAALELSLSRTTATTSPAAALAGLVPSVRRLLTAQFHDILPGTSIALAHRVAVEWLRTGQAEAVAAAVASVSRALLASGRAGRGVADRWLFNPAATHLSGLLPADRPGDPPLQFSIPPLSLRRIGAGQSVGPMDEADVVCSAELAAPAAASAPAAPPALPTLRFARGADTLAFEVDPAAATARVVAASDAWAAAEAVTAGEAFHSLVRCTDQPWFWDAWDVMVDRSERAELLLGPRAGRYEATAGDGEMEVPLGEPAPESLPPAAAAGAGGEWARVDTRHRLGPAAAEGASALASSDPDAWAPSRYARPADSAGCLTVRFEGVSGPDPLLRITTALPPGQGMHWRGRRDSLRAVFRFAGLPTSCVATFDTAFGAATRPATARDAREDMLHETCMHRWVALSAPMSAAGGAGGGGALVVARAKHGVEVRGNCVALTLDRRVEAPDPGPHATGECAYAVAFFSGPLDPLWARRTAAAVAGPAPVLVGPADLAAAADSSCPADAALETCGEPPEAGVVGPLCSVAPASPRERCCPLLEAVKLPRLAVDLAVRSPAGAEAGARSIIVRVREACGLSGTAVLTTPPATAVRLLDLLERPLSPPIAAPAGRAIAPAELPSVAEPLGAALPPARPWWELSDQEWAVAAPGRAEAPPARFESSPGVERVCPGTGGATQWRVPIGALAVVTAEVLLE